MKKNYLIPVLAALVLSISGCDKFLDRQPDEHLSSENIFEKKESTWKYLVNVYSFIPEDGDSSGYGNSPICIPCSDEAASSFGGNRFYAAWIHDQVSPLTSGGSYRNTAYKYMYQAIREATYFMENVHSCPELSDAEKDIWYAEARFLRAFYYTELLKWNGPVIFNGDELVDFNDPSLNDTDRSPWSVIVDWLCGEFDEAARFLPYSWDPTTDLGRATMGAALAMKARLLLMNARPLFNGQNGTGMYDGIVNKYGEALFNTEYDESRWKEAADAAYNVIRMNLYSLVDDKSKEPLENIHNAFITLDSPENIFVRMSDGRPWRRNETPAQTGGGAYGGVGVTQKLVDAFAMENGYYPIMNMEEESYGNGAGPENGGVLEIDPRSGYSESGSSDFVHPFFEKFTVSSTSQTSPVRTMNMYVGREPRFYANIFWSGQTWVTGTNVFKDIQFYSKGASGPQSGVDYPPTGYVCLKFINPQINTTGNPGVAKWGQLAWPVIRYADILLMYVEALNEYDPGNSDILLYWNMVRSRAGVPDIEELYPEIVGDKELQRKYIRRERMVELCFEGKRYFDTRQWMIAEQEDDGHVYGCNIAATDHDPEGEYWKRTSIFDTFGDGGFMTPRVFGKKNYLFPINQEEIDRVPEITQNYGW